MTITANWFGSLAYVLRGFSALLLWGMLQQVSYYIISVSCDELVNVLWTLWTVVTVGMTFHIPDCNGFIFVYIFKPPPHGGGSFWRPRSARNTRVVIWGEKFGELCRPCGSNYQPPTPDGDGAWTCNQLKASSLCCESLSRRCHSNHIQSSSRTC